MSDTEPPGRISHGEVQCGDVDLRRASERELRTVRGGTIAMIFQDALGSLNPVMTVGAQLREAILEHRPVSRREADEHAVELLREVGVPTPESRMAQYPHEFSGGMRQRVMIAMALCNDPKLLIADEPTTALDVTVQAQILDLLERLKRELDTAIVMITHDLGVVAEVTDDIAVMYAGRIVEYADKDAIFAAPEHPYTWGLLRSIPRLDSPRDEELVPIPGRPPSLINPPSGCSFHPRCPYVLEAHTRVDPMLEPIAGNVHHAVACLLPTTTRKALWGALAEGASAETAKSLAAERTGAAAGSAHVDGGTS